MTSKVTSVTHCVRCGNNHRAMTFHTIPAGATHWGVCPGTQEILFSVSVDPFADTFQIINSPDSAPVEIDERTP